MNRIIAILLFLLSAAAVRASDLVDISMSSRFLVRGEKAVLEIIYRSEDINARVAVPSLPMVRGVEIRPLRDFVQRRFGENRRLEHFIPLVISSLDPGNHVIPPIELLIEGETRRTPAVEFQVFPATELQWTTATVRNQRVRYAAAFHALKRDPYVGEKQPMELKIYFPTDVMVADWGIPDFERNGVSAWRFQPQYSEPAIVQLSQGSHYAIPYPTSASANVEGPSTVGPALLTMQVRLPIVDNFGRPFTEPLKLTAPALHLDSKPLPPSPPAGFDNAVGQFDLKVTSDETEVREGDPVTVEITISGSGNLDSINPPKPTDVDGWKLYDATALERGEERRQLSGQVVFRQFMRPLKSQKSIPPFKLVYFDPAKASYETLLTASIPLRVLPSTAPGMTLAPPPVLAMPLEEMTDILGVVNPAGGLLAERFRIPPVALNLLPALLALILVGFIIRRHLIPRLQKDPDRIARHQDWRELERAPDPKFYRAAGRFIERWLGHHRDPLIDEVLQRRDDSSFRQDQDEIRVDRAERNRILKQLRRIALPLAALLLALSSSNTRAAEEPPGQLFEEGRYREAAKGWLESGPYERLSADTLYNIGNAAYRMGLPGQAALYYRRSLERDSAHPESRQNLRFLERKFGSIVIQRPDYEHLIARLPLGFWKGLVAASGWAVLLAVLVFPATRPGAGPRVAAITALVTAPLLAVCGAVGWHYFPDDARFAPSREQAVVVADTTIVRTDAARASARVIEAPAGSLCRFITRSGDWAYIAFTNDSRGWVPLSDIRLLIPEGAPEAPEPPPRSASDSNA